MVKYDSCKILWTGDINASHSRSRATDNDKKCMAFCKETDIQASPHTPPVPTYHHFSGNITSQIDYFIVPKQQTDIISSISVDIRNPTNCSTHDAILAQMKPRLVHVDEPKANRVTLPNRVKWEKVDTDMYYQLTEEKITVLYESIDDNTPTEIIAHRLNTILTEVSQQCQPNIAKKPRKRTRYTWGPEVYPYMKESKKAFGLWKKEGRPTNPCNRSLLKYKTAKRELRKIQRQICARERQETYNKIMKASESDQTTFHHLIRNQRVHQKSNSNK
jgi:hypothetical protein